MDGLGNQLDIVRGADSCLDFRGHWVGGSVTADAGAEETLPFDPRPLTVYGRAIPHRNAKTRNVITAVIPVTQSRSGFTFRAFHTGWGVWGFTPQQEGTLLSFEMRIVPKNPLYGLVYRLAGVRLPQRGMADVVTKLLICLELTWRTSVHKGREMGEPSSLGIGPDPYEARSTP